MLMLLESLLNYPELTDQRSSSERDRVVPRKLLSQKVQLKKERKKILLLPNLKNNRMVRNIRNIWGNDTK